MRETTRRSWIFGAVAAIATVSPGSSAAAPTSGIQERRLANRIELWSSFSRRTKTMVARYSAKRQSSLLHEPLIVTGTLGFNSPSTLVLRDDDLSGSTTKIGAEGEPFAIIPNQSSVPRGPHTDPENLPAMRWLRDRLLALFNPGDGSALLANSRSLVPRGRAPRLELLPPLDSPTRKLLRSLTITFDPVGGAVLIIDLTEAQGDRIVVHVSDHRQNPGEAELRRVLEDPR
jgi:hypothetical protein